MDAPYNKPGNPLARADDGPQPVKVSITDLDMPIGSMVVLLLKLAVAAIPAAMVIGFVTFVLMVLLAILGAGMGLSKM